MGHLRPPEPPMPEPPVIVPAWPGTWGITTDPEPSLTPILAFVVAPRSFPYKEGTDNVANADAPETNVVDFDAARKKSKASGNNAGAASNSCPGHAHPAFTPAYAIAGAVSPGAPARTSYEAYWWPGDVVAFQGDVMAMEDFLKLKGLAPGTFTATE